MESLEKEEIHFLSEPTDDYFCPICTNLLTEPFLTDCGHHFCRECRGRLLASGRVECPVCPERNALKDARLNKHLQRQVNDLKVHCKHHEEGCKWKGELRDLQAHLDPVRRRCGFVLITCSLGCGERVQSGAMKEHKKSHCRKRPSTCEHCGYHNAHDIVTEKHHPLRCQFPVDCPNKCQVEGLKGRQLQAHISCCP